MCFWKVENAHMCCFNKKNRHVSLKRYIRGTHSQLAPKKLTWLPLVSELSVFFFSSPPRTSFKERELGIHLQTLLRCFGWFIWTESCGNGRLTESRFSSWVRPVYFYIFLSTFSGTSAFLQTQGGEILLWDLSLSVRRYACESGGELDTFPCFRYGSIRVRV